MQVVIDTREQRPFEFSRFDCSTTRATLPTGDYSLLGLEDRVAIERKSLDDLVSCLMGSNRERFQRELERASELEMFAVVTEASWEDLSRGRYRPQMRPVAALQSICSWMAQFGFPFLFPGSRRAAEYITHSLLAKYHEHKAAIPAADFTDQAAA